MLFKKYLVVILVYTIAICVIQLINNNVKYYINNLVTSSQMQRGMEDVLEEGPHHHHSHPQLYTLWPGGMENLATLGGLIDNKYVSYNTCSNKHR